MTSYTEQLETMITDERTALADLLDQLPADAWDQPSLCAGWRIRETVAHITMPFRYSMPKFLGEVMRSGGRFNVMADRCARRDAARSPAELAAEVRNNIAHPWSPPGGGRTGALAHDVIHTMDIATPLGIDPHLPQGTLRTVLDTFTDGDSLKHFGTHLDGVRLAATDMDCSFGAGETVHGSARDLLSTLSGRALPLGHLTGATARLVH